MVSKELKATFRMTIDMRLVHAGTMAEQFLMLEMKAFVSGLKKIKCFTSLDTCSGYLQYPLDP